MNKPLPTRVPPLEPKKPERTTVKVEYHSIPAGDSLSESIAKLAAAGVTDLSGVFIDTAYDRSGDTDGYTLDWETKISVTQSDTEWARTMAQYAEDMAEYRRLLDLYAKADTDYKVRLAEWEQTEKDRVRDTELYQLRRLRAKYPDVDLSFAPPRGV